MKTSNWICTLFREVILTGAYSFSRKESYGVYYSWMYENRNYSEELKQEAGEILFLSAIATTLMYDWEDLLTIPFIPYIES